MAILAERYVHGSIEFDRPIMTVTIVIPVHASHPDAVGDLEACLEGIRNAHDGAGAEVIVVDDGSPLESAIARAATQAGATHIRLARNRGPATARNRGAAAASGEILVFLDSDTIPHPDAIGRLRDALEADLELAAVFGSYDDTPSAPGAVSRFRNLLHHWVHQHSAGAASTFWAGCGAIRRSVFQEIGGFDESYRRSSIEDVALGAKLKAAGHRIELHPEIQATHRKRWTLGSMLHTDLFARAVPWTQLLLRGAGLPRDLNFTWAQRLSVACAAILWFGWPWSPLAAFLAAVSIALLNRRFHRFLAGHGGWPFAAAGFAAHTLHFCCSAVGFAIGVARSFPALAVVPFAVFAVQFSTGAYRADWGEFPDETAHFATGLMVSEWLRNPLGNPIAFAERYYTLYPVVAIGHWPPLYYAVSGAWALLAGSSRAASLILTALVCVAFLASIYLPIHKRNGMPAAAAATALVLFNPHVVEALSLVMLDVAAALAVWIAALLWARYMDDPRPATSVLFGVAASVCLLIKQSTLVLIPMPLLGVIFAGRPSLMLKPHFWAAPLTVLVLAGPWHLYTFNVLYSDWQRWSSPGEGARNWAVPLLAGGLTLFGAALVGIAIPGRRRLDSATAAAVALAAAICLCVPLIGALREPRHLLTLLPACAFLAARTLRRPAAIVAAALLFLAVDSTWTHRTPGSNRSLAARLDQTPPGPVLLLSSDMSETRIIASIAETSPAPKRQWVRATKFLALVTWSGRIREIRFPTELALSDAIADAGFSAILSRTIPGTPRPPYQESLDVVMQRQSTRWTRTAIDPNTILYERIAPVAEPARLAPFYMPRLGRNLGDP